MAEKEKGYYIFRINYAEDHKLIADELAKGRLRQGWGTTGTDLRRGEEDYIAQYPDGDEGYYRRKYRNLLLMKDIKPGAILVIPKLNPMGKDDQTSFTIVRCTGEYHFETIQSKQGKADFGHCIPVDTCKSFTYCSNHQANVVAAKFKAYRSPINRVWSREFMDAVEELLANDTLPCSGERRVMENLSGAAQKERMEYLKALVDALNSKGASDLERLLQELFEQNGYVCTGRNQYDGKGADVDLIFAPYPRHTLMGAIAAMADPEVLPEIRVQAKKKVGLDINDSEGVAQLIKSPKADQAINILVSLTTEFSEKAQNMANEHGIILINGMALTELLVHYGLWPPFDAN